MASSPFRRGRRARGARQRARRAQRRRRRHAAPGRRDPARPRARRRSHGAVARSRPRRSPAPAARWFRDAIRRRRVERVPVAYLVGHKGFRHLDLLRATSACSSRAPRPSTSSEALLDLPPNASRARRRHRQRRDARSRQARAAGPSRSPPPTPSPDSARRRRARGAALRSFSQGDLLDGVDPHVDAIVSNPPYVPDGDRLTMMPEVAAEAKLPRSSPAPTACGPSAAARGRAGTRAPRSRWRSGAGRRPRCARWSRRRRIPGGPHRDRPRRPRARRARERCRDHRRAGRHLRALHGLSAACAVFGADTVYGLACDVASLEAVERLYAIKGRRPDKPAAVMFFTGPGDRRAARAGPAHDQRAGGRCPVRSRCCPTRAGAPLACGPDRTPSAARPRAGAERAALAAVRWPVLQSSANAGRGGADARRLEDIPAPIRDAADLLLDAGELAGRPRPSSTCGASRTRAPGTMIREGAVASELRGSWRRCLRCRFRHAMVIAVGSDHAGYHLKEHVKDVLLAAGHEIVDVGTGTPGLGRTTRPSPSRQRLGRRRPGRPHHVGVRLGRRRRDRRQQGRGRSRGRRRGERPKCEIQPVATTTPTRSTLTGARLAPADADAIVERFLRTTFEGGRHAPAGVANRGTGRSGVESPAIG